jgi:flagellar basal body-associated protein FliL
MDQQRRTAQAAQQVEKRIGFYVHLTVFVLVCAGLAAVNVFATPEVWWAQWPFLGWGVAVVFHGLCAYRRGPDTVASGRLRKIRELSEAEPVPRERTASKSTMSITMLVVGIVLGALVGSGYVYLSVRDAREETRKAQEATAAAEKTAKQLDAELQQASKARSDVEATLKETKNQLDQTEASKRMAEQRLQELRTQVTQANEAKEAAERALAEAKKNTQ